MNRVDSGRVGSGSTRVTLFVPGYRVLGPTQIRATRARESRPGSSEPDPGSRYPIRGNNLFSQLTADETQNREYVVNCVKA